MPYNSAVERKDIDSSLTSKQKSVFKAKLEEFKSSGMEEEEAIQKALDLSRVIPQEKSIVKNTTSVVTDEMISYEIVYEPNVKDAHGEWMSAETIRAGRDNFEKNKLDGHVSENLFHLTNTDKFTIEKTWIQEEFDVFVGETSEKISAGTWVAKVKYNDESLWALKKAGIVGGLSIQCSGYISDDGEITQLNFDPEDIDEED